MREQLAETKMHALDYWQVIRNRWGTILLTFLLVCLAAMIIISLLEKKHVGRVKLQVHHDSKDGVFSKEMGGMSNTWLETEFKIITSRETYNRVVRTKGLAKRWNLGNDENAAVDKLSRMVETNEERGTDLIAIEVYSPKAEEAAELANAVAEAYEERRKDYEKGRSENAVNMLQMELDSQEKKVEEKRVNMLTLMKKYNIIDFGGIHSIFNGMTGNVDNGEDISYKQMAARMAEYDQEVGKL